MYESNAQEIRQKLKDAWDNKERDLFDGINSDKGFFFITPLELYNRSFRYYAKPVSVPEEYYKSCLQYLVDLNEFLKKKGVPLVVIICPVYDELFYDEILHVDIEKVPFINYARAKLIEDSLKHGIIAVDILPTLLKHRTSDSFLYYYNLDNLHISPLGSYFSISYIADLAGISTVLQTKKQVFQLNSRFLKSYKGDDATLYPAIGKSDKNISDILVAGDSMSLEGYGFPDAVRHFYQSHVETISMPSRSGEILAELKKREVASKNGFLKQFSACFFIMNGNYINVAFKTNDLLKIEEAAKNKEAQIITSPVTEYDGKQSTKYKLHLNDTLRKSSRLIVAANIPEQNYILRCNGTIKIRCDITGFSGNNIYPVCFELSHEEFETGDVELDIELPLVNGKSRKAVISNITIASAPKSADVESEEVENITTSELSVEKKHETGDKHKKDVKPEGNNLIPIAVPVVTKKEVMKKTFDATQP